jgi:BirA family biotin operon repressor/biotin-[acetyl-CoA-carboxylase] ligase
MNKTFDIITFKQLESTNLKMQEDYSAGSLQLNTVYVTDFQQSGRGTDQNIWHSEAGKNLLFSIAIKPDNLHPSQQFMLTKAISLAVTDSLALYLDSDLLKIKWPNDIYFQNSKLGGILITHIINGNTIELSIIGIGINVNQHDFPVDLPNPISMTQITHKEFDLSSLLENVLLSVNDRISQLKDVDLHHFISFEYLSRLFRLETWSFYKYRGESVEARVLGVNGYGQLLLEKKDGMHVQCDLKEIEFLFE